MIRYPEEELSSPRGLIPFMAVVQKRKVRLMLDYWELNGHVDAYTAHANVCAEKQRIAEERVQCVCACYVYFKWSFTGDKDICLTRMGFWLNVAQAVMKDIVVTVLVKGESLFDRPLQLILTKYISMKI